MIGDGVRAVIVHEFGVGDGFGPRCRVTAAEDPEISLHFLVYSFSFTISLQVVGCGEG